MLNAMTLARNIMLMEKTGEEMGFGVSGTV